MKEMPDNSVDSIVTDPPYELGFMGKSWDSTGIANSVEVWQEALRVLKPGGHLIAFSGSRTYHRMAVAIEDAGFEIRDQIMWVYGSGFPKSHNVSKGIDKGMGENRARQLKFTTWMRGSGLSQKDCAKAIRHLAKNDETANAMAQHYYSDKQQPAIPTLDIFDAVRNLLPNIPDEIEQLVVERTGIEWTEYKNRKVIGTREVPIGHAFAGEVYGGDSSNQEINITAPSTPQAQQWDGWGTALKPAHEPIVLARKPLIGTVANNVLTWGTGGLNIDGCRVGTDDTRSPSSKSSFGLINDDSWQAQEVMAGSASGRWPANFIHDGSDEVNDLLGEPARFFYCAKASKRDRNEGLEGFEKKHRAGLVGADRTTEEKLDPVSERFRTQPVANNHPTVKPTDLMRYLVRLVTQPNGTVLDPFMGSGSTGKACAYEGFDFIGIEQSAEYVEIARARIEYAQKQEKDYLL